MYKLWFERPRMTAHDDLLEGVAEATGPDVGGAPLSNLAQAHGVIAGSLRYDADVMDLAPKLKVIARTGIGVDTVDLAAATARGIVVVNTPGAPSVPTAEHTMMLLLAVAKRLKTSEARLKAQAGDYHARHGAIELAGKTLGLLGLGRIASLVAQMAQGFDMRIVAFDPYIPPQVAEAKGAELAATFDALLAQADILSLHIPLTPGTRQLMNKEAFANMRRGSIFINAGRGGLVDEVALLEALESGHLFGAGLDVTDPEPAPPDHPLLRRKDVVVTPHVASATPEGRARMFVGAVTQALQVLKGERPPHVVNPEVWQS